MTMHKTPKHRASRRGFTLVELLVSAGLTVLMLLLFATIFQLASGSVTTQRGIAENDQRARTLTTIIKADLKRRTMKIVLPFARNEKDDSEAGFDPNIHFGRFAERRGYFFISENDPANPSDDVLQFVVELADDEPPNYGKAESVAGMARSSDGIGNSTAVSKYAVISYFLRRGVLYRRVMLIRDAADRDEAQPKENAGMPPADFFRPSDPMFTPHTNPYRDLSILNSFDFAMFPDSGAADSDGAVFHGSFALDNSEAGPASGNVLANPTKRFGHSDASGRPREFVAGEFIGRFTHEETSHIDFRYPNYIGVTGMMNPLTPMNDTSLTITNGVVDQYRGGLRRAEDTLMTNVSVFDIQVWDEFADPDLDPMTAPTPAFVDIGGATAGDYRTTSNAGYRSNAPVTAHSRNIFDTWHPTATTTSTVGTAPYNPPFRPSNTTVTPNVERPLKAIQITILYYDQTSDQIRQLTLIESLDEEDEP